MPSAQCLSGLNFVDVIHIIHEAGKELRQNTGRSRYAQPACSSFSPKPVATLEPNEVIYQLSSAQRLAAHVELLPSAVAPKSFATSSVAAGRPAARAAARILVSIEGSLNHSDTRDAITWGGSSEERWGERLPES